MRSLALKTLALLALTTAAKAAPLTMEMQVDRPLIKADSSDSVVLRLGLRAPAVERSHRAPLNLALVLDRSGSMGGNKINRLREAARHAVKRLRADDILSIIAFDTEAQVLLPASKLRDARAALNAIDSLEPAGSTALYGGVKEGLEELKKFKGRNRVSRIILISDGLANVGPSSPGQLAELGREAGAQGIPVTTFGLGYDFGEDLMTRLALASDGNHAFIPDEGGLAAYFDKELGEALAIAARDIVLEIRLSEGVRFKGSLDREVEVKGDVLRWRLNQLPGGVEKRLLLEVEAPATRRGAKQELATARLSYSDAEGRSQADLKAESSVTGAEASIAEKAEVPSVSADAALARANSRRDEAIRLRDAGQAQAASEVLKQNADELKEMEKKTGISGLGAAASTYSGEAREMAAPEADWNASRKLMKARSYKDSTQQSY